ncbi:MAG: hypothetical protein PHU49_07535 [Syntrophorhabdaceae bacterium]|nr:hypothetical protein [Syntrophorhabdaceae bacterium]MDD5243855.1 hypothetical protein [Syntrophorhabdaceae bacterium]
MRILLSVIFLLLLTFPCFAQDPHGPVQSYKCPDEVQCKQRMYNNYGSGSSEQTIGTIHNVKCCYKFPTGCRPWHCDGDKTNQEYWWPNATRPSRSARKTTPGTQTPSAPRTLKLISDTLEED